MAASAAPVRGSRAGVETAIFRADSFVQTAQPGDIVLGKKAGLGPRQLHEVVSTSTGNGVQFQSRVPRSLARNFKPVDNSDISFEDRELRTAFAKRLGAPLLLVDVSQLVYPMDHAVGISQEDGA